MMGAAVEIPVAIIGVASPGVEAVVDCAGMAVCAGTSGACVGAELMVDTEVGCVPHEASNITHTSRNRVNGFISFYAFHSNFFTYTTAGTTSIFDLQDRAKAARSQLLAHNFW